MRIGVKEVNINDSKIVKKEFNKLGFALLMKEVISNLIVFVFIMVMMMIHVLKEPNMTNNQLLEILDNGTYNGILSIAAVIISFIPLLIYRGRTFFQYDLRVENRKFRLKTVIIGIIILLSLNSLLVLFANILELGLNWIGLSANSALEDLDTLNELSIPMIIYSCMLGPIIEEFIYRGIVLRSLEKYGKGIAIFISSLLFGLMHGNFFQVFMAMGLGLILGYLAMEYSIKLTIILHIINNILVEIFSQISFNINSTLENIIDCGFIILSMIIVIGFYFRYKIHIKKWLENNRIQKWIITKFFTSILIIIVIILDLFKVISGISAIS